MKFKKVAKIFLSCVLAGAVFTGCGGGEQAATDKPANNSAGETVKLGMLNRINADETKMGSLLDTFAENLGVKGTKHLPKFYDNLRTMQLAIESGDIDSFSTYQCVADYLVANNDKFEISENSALNKLVDNFCFAVRADDKELKSELDKAIDEMKADGTLDKFINEYITGVNKGKTPPKVEIPNTEGAQSLKVGITGDLPPLDLVLSDDSPAGFNTAMLAEISKRLGKNIKIVQIETGARAAALNANLIDVVFWAIVPIGGEIPGDIDKPKGLELSNPYFKDNVAVIKLKSDK